MSVLTRIRKYLFGHQPETLPEAAYDLWAASYDNQPNNLMLSLDTSLFTELLGDIVITNKRVIDIGCGTGRHWNKLLEKQPASLTGYDVSEEMLLVLKQKFPGQETIRLTGTQLNRHDNSCDIIISTLAIAHIENIKAALQEWHRVLKPGGEMIITDYHPEALQKGGTRTFSHKGRLIAVKNYIHPVEALVKEAKQLEMDILRFADRKIDDSVKSWYESQNALPIFEKFTGIPIIYGIHLKKKDVIT